GLPILGDHPPETNKIRMFPGERRLFRRWLPGRRDLIRWLALPVSELGTAHQDLPVAVVPEIDRRTLALEVLLVQLTHDSSPDFAPRRDQFRGILEQHAESWMGRTRGLELARLDQQAERLGPFAGAAFDQQFNALDVLRVAALRVCTG